MKTPLTCTIQFAPSDSMKTIYLPTKNLIFILLLLICAGCSNLPSYTTPVNSGQLANIESSGASMLCGLNGMVCKAFVRLVDGAFTGAFTSSVDIEPGQHTLQLACLFKTSALEYARMTMIDQTVEIAPNGKYHVDGVAEGDSCRISLIKDSTNEVVRPGITIVKASAYGTYPTSEKISFYSSANTISTWTETAAEDYLIPDSQVFISGRGGKSGFVGGILGGMSGSLIGTSMDRANNASAVSTLKEKLGLTFNHPLSEALQASIAAHSGQNKYIQANTDRDAQLLLLPSARITVYDDGLASLSFRLTVRIQNQQNGKEDTKTFFYQIGKKMPLEGPGSWTENNSRAILDSATIALAKLSAALLDDIEGVDTINNPNASKSDSVFRVH